MHIFCCSSWMVPGHNCLDAEMRRDKRRGLDWVFTEGGGWHYGRQQASLHPATTITQNNLQNPRIQNCWWYFPFLSLQRHLGSLGEMEMCWKQEQDLTFILKKPKPWLNSPKIALSSAFFDTAHSNLIFLHQIAGYSIYSTVPISPLTWSASTTWCAS